VEVFANTFMGFFENTLAIGTPSVANCTVNSLEIVSISQQIEIHVNNSRWENAIIE